MIYPEIFLDSPHLSAEVIFSLVCLEAAEILETSTHFLVLVLL